MTRKSARPARGVVLLFLFTFVFLAGFVATATAQFVDIPPHAPSLGDEGGATAITPSVPSLSWQILVGVAAVLAMAHIPTSVWTLYF
jgi:Na+-transporting methylmalonyl-CoA/oxaloacetate decarboxylase gamma subunit